MSARNPRPGFSEPCRKWLGRLVNLNAARTATRGVAPHKPIMLLTVLDLVEAGLVNNRSLRLDVELACRFRSYWAAVQDRQRNAPEIAMPFHALGGNRDRIWERFTADGDPSHAKSTTRLARIDEELFGCLLDPEFRREARRAMIARYFTSREQAWLCARLGLPLPKSQEIEAVRRDAARFKNSLRVARDARFKVEVVSGYKFTCALTGYCPETVDSVLVQAAHIHQRASGGTDDMDNGLALTPDAHWMFDDGVWTAVPRGKEFIVEVKSAGIRESSPHGRSLVAHQGKPLYFHPGTKLRPGARHFEWHRRNVFESSP